MASEVLDGGVLTINESRYPIRLEANGDGTYMVVVDVSGTPHYQGDVVLTGGVVSDTYLVYVAWVRYVGAPILKTTLKDAIRARLDGVPE